MERNNGVTIWHLRDLINSTQSLSTEHEDLGWIPKRPLGWTTIGMRLKAMLMIWRGQADAVVWPGGQ